MAQPIGRTAQDSHQPWSPGAWSRLPFVGVFSLLGALLGACGSAVVITISNLQPITSWTIQPTVYLSIIATITHMLLGVALAEGVTITWWRKTLKQDTTVGDLHRFWNFGNSVKAALFAGRKVNKLAIACILVALAAASGPLLQRATRVVVAELDGSTELTLHVAGAIPTGYTGFISGRGLEPSLWTANFSSIVSNFISQQPIPIDPTDCRGICTTTVKGAGFAVNCSTYEVPYNLNGAAGGTPQWMTALLGITAFWTEFFWEALYHAGSLRVNVQHKGSAACEGQLQIHNCTLREAVVEYPVVIDGNKSSIELSPDTTIYDDRILEYIMVPYEGMEGDATSIGGMSLALRNLYNSNATLRWVGPDGYELIPQGTVASQFASGDPHSIDCSVRWSDPMPYLLEQARELMFRTAVGAAFGNSSYMQTVHASEVATLPVFQSHYGYLAGSMGIVVLAVMSILLTFHQYWHFGRAPSMSPIEIAKACRASFLEGVNSNAAVDRIVKQVGDRPVHYGATNNHQNEQDADEATKMYRSYVTEYRGPEGGEGESSALAMDDPIRLRSPRKGVVYQ